jgi:hypothetical protein
MAQTLALDKVKASANAIALSLFEVSSFWKR